MPVSHTKRSTSAADRIPSNRPGSARAIVSGRRSQDSERNELRPTGSSVSPTASCPGVVAGVGRVAGVAAVVTGVGRVRRVAGVVPGVGVVALEGGGADDSTG